MLWGMNCKFTGDAMYFSAVKQGLRYNRTYNSYPRKRVLYVPLRGKSLLKVCFFTSLFLLAVRMAESFLTAVAVQKLCAAFESQ